MSLFTELTALDYPSEFVVEYMDGTRERLLRGDGVHITPKADDPNGIGGLSAELPRKHPQNKLMARYVRFTELRAIRSVDGILLWPSA